MGTFRSVIWERRTGTSLSLILLFTPFLLCLLPSSLAREFLSLKSLSVSSFSGLSSAIRRANQLKVTVHVQLRSNIAVKRRLPVLEPGAGVRITGSCKGRCTLDGKGRFPIFVAVNTTSTSPSSSAAEAGPVCTVVLENVVVKRARGGVLHGRCFFTARNSVFQDNVADEDGGAVVNIQGNGLFQETQGDPVPVYIRRCTFKRNTALDGNGGAIVSSYGNNGMLLDIAHSVFAGNRARDGCGGAISLQNKDRIVLRNTSFERNVANDSGGAICMDGYESSLLSMDSVFSNNRALHGEGGAVAVIRFPRVDVQFCRTTFNGNRAGTGGEGSTNADNSLVAEDVEAMGAAADGDTVVEGSAASKDDGGAAKETKADNGIVEKSAAVELAGGHAFSQSSGKPAVNSSHDVVVKGEWPCSVKFCPQVPRSGVRFFIMDEEWGFVFESPDRIERDCIGCSGCAGDCNKLGKCQLDADANATCKCKDGYDPTDGCSYCLPFFNYNPTDGCKGCVPGFEGIKAEKGSLPTCSPCAGLDQIPNTPTNMTSFSSATFEPSLDACIAQFNNSYAVNTAAYFTEGATKACRRACVLFLNFPTPPGLCKSDGQLHFLPRRSMYYLEKERSVQNCI